MESDDYHDYVIKEGELIGAFEEMYRNCPDPWNQDRITLKKRLALTVAEDHADHYDRVLDVGCGKGNFTRLVQATIAGSVVGIDTSPTALATAKSRFPAIEFLCSEIPPVPCRSDAFDLVVLSELLWYVLSDIDSLFDEIDRVTTTGAVCLVVQHFPDDQSYGNDVMCSPDDLVAIVPFDLLQHVEVHEDAGTAMVGLFAT